MSVILNEREFAEAAIRNGELGNKPYITLNCLAKYYYAEGYRKARIAKLLEEFLTKCDPRANIVKWQNVIEQISRDSGKYPMIEIDSVPITKDELSACRAIKGQQVQRLLFTLIALAKFSHKANPNNQYWVNFPDKDIFRLANITTSIKRQSLLLNDLMNAGYIKFSKKIDNVSINVCCVSENSEIVVSLTDFRNIGNQYMKLCGMSYIECASCGAVVKKSNNSQKYCPDCAVVINRQKSLNRWINTRYSKLS